MQEQSFGRYVSVIYRHLQILLNHRLNSYGIGSGQYIFLSAIYKNEGISQKELTNLIKIDRATTAKALKKLEKNGYVNRVQDSEDKRYYKLYLTKKGIEFIPTLKNILNDLTNMLCMGMSNEQYTETLKSLNLILNNVQNAVELLRIEEEL
ncbi:DNA-binding MarR family transcriptional regulator [Clostridium tetanomorphum]|uniref:MarR family transcriptional regulator n=1 Tax=Clostridium tetanomorphum TaxID=1553 RepID=A0A923J0X7_CLOTT|nr:MarR family transcriptional regulator [Clostridium tetanomorphum]KAJ52733.1 MarR family transcriptional regulator [Clostridium tetanomorphum DSM 665]MBC2396713.1 MarR family transcriptional regulator [Clostridium tetanomorphum]MBP1863328.1 DNA-binding MarR family transcriptional regulator [Clostridium tetanomorphum]NRS84436.1 DNA-binding MarR family transcriptional regulator [Clostridium tetanomorphum]NRZ97650.1 DNA-binding MarR family transcriptional regulator [Clostridium tetanomorphum]